MPIVEPEVLMDGEHTIERSEEVTEMALRQLFAELAAQNVALTAMLLKPNMILSGYGCSRQAGVDQVAARTVDCFRRVVPAAVAGITFLSGGQSDEAAYAHLNAINRIGGQPWELSFSYGRALQATPLAIWRGLPSEVAAAQASYLQRARWAGAARCGEYSADLGLEPAPTS